MSDKYVFIDRDGVINKDPEGWTEYGYVASPEELHIIKGAAEGIKKLTDAGYKNVIISNQQGVGKGYFTDNDLKKVTEKMTNLIDEKGGKITEVYYCTHTKDENCSCRKPKAGLFLIAQKELGIDSFEGKFYIGDTERDIQAGKEAGLKTILVLSGKNVLRDTTHWENRPDHIFNNLLEASEFIVKGEYV
ncbi:MAG: HAD-IIIA family hydrolase [Candidatus Aadella gelida]|nr:HAD-IIIA family hydrolase [Candidatus Aadella gelida]